MISRFPNSEFLGGRGGAATAGALDDQRPADSPGDHLDSCPRSDLANGGDGTLATSSSGSQYSGSRVETPVSCVGEEDEDEDEFNENDEDDD